MARRTSVSPVLTEAKLNRRQVEAAIQRIRRRIDAVSSFDVRQIRVYSDANALISPLCASIDDALVQSFGLGTVEYSRYSSASTIHYPESFYGDPSILEVHTSVLSEKKRVVGLLQSAVAALEERLEEFGSGSDAVGAPEAQIKSVTQTISLNRKIFVVHGHDVASRELVTGFLSALGFSPIVLHKQANLGRTIIEKFESESDVGFAVVLLTPDDVGGQVSGLQSPRARQNVLLELGYFIGKLGRSRVAALKGEGVEVPSDILGIVWIPLDEKESWKLPLARELRACGYDVDMNRVL